jgi:hypothetical protein
MLQACSRVIAAIAMVVALSTAQAAEPTALTLACKGTVTDSAKLSDDKDKAWPWSTGIVVNFANRTVQGFLTHPGGVGFEEYYPVKITSWDDVFVGEGRGLAQVDGQP